MEYGREEMRQTLLRTLKVGVLLQYAVGMEWAEYEILTYCSLEAQAYEDSSIDSGILHEQQ